MSAKSRIKKEKAPELPEQSAASRPVFYAKIAWIALAVAVSVAAVVLASAASRATVSLELKREVQEQEVTVRVVTGKEDTRPEASVLPVIAGDIVVSSGSARATKAVASIQSRVGRAAGNVTIVNSTNRSQPLVATTRLLSPNGVLFRITQGVVVPAGGRTAVSAVAAEPGAGGDVGPTRWRIPGLSPALQTRIYGLSTSAMNGGLVEVRRVDEVDRAEVAARAEMEAKKKAEESLSVATSLARFSRVTLTERTLNAKAGANVPEVVADARVTVTHVLVDPAVANDLLRSFLGQEAKKAHRELVDAFVDVSSFELGKIFRSEGAVELAGSVRVTTRRSLDGLVPEVRSLVAGLEREQAIVRLQSRPDLEKVAVRISPPWLWTLPSRTDRIRVLVK